MKTEKKHPAALVSEQLICKALLKLLEQENLPQITVTRLCEEAGVGRKTFYRHFETLEDVIDRMAEAFCEAYALEMAGKRDEEKLLQHFAFLKKHMDFLLMLHRNRLMARLEAFSSAQAAGMMPVWSAEPVQQHFCSAYIQGGLSALVYVWAERGFQDTPEQLAEIARKCIG